MHSSDELLRQSLSNTKSTPAPYSIGSMFWLAFFGGILAVVPYSLLTMRRLDRLKQDAWLPLLGALVCVAMSLGYLSFEVIPKGEAMRFTTRLLGLAYTGLFYWKYRAIFRACEIYDENRPSPWIPALGCLLFSIALVSVLVWILR